MPHTPVTPNPRARGAACLRVVAVLLALAGPLGAAVDAHAETPTTAAPSSGPTAVADLPPSNDPSQNATFGIGPASAQGPDGRASLDYVVTPGVQLSDDVAVTNLSTDALDLAIYPSDVIPGRDAAAELPPSATAAVDAGTWISIDIADHPRTIRVPGRTTVVVPIKVAVPGDATAGDHAAGILVSLTSDARNDRGDLVHVEQRVAVRAHLRVSGALHPQLEVQDLDAVYRQNLHPVGAGAVDLSYTVRNTGNVRLAGHQHVSFRGLLGTEVTATDPPEIPVLLPGASVTVTAHVDGVLPEIVGWPTVRVEPVAAPGDADPNLGTTELSIRIWTLPIVLMILVATLLLALWAYRRWRRRRARRAAGDARDGDDDGDAGDDGEPSDPDGAGATADAAVLEPAVGP